MGKSHPSIDIIKHFAKSSEGLFEEIGPLYEKGLSITDIAKQTGFKRPAVWRELKKHLKDLRAQDPIPFERWRKGRGKTRARPPYGFCYLQGAVVKCPTEYPTLLLIRKLWSLDVSITAIVDKLAEKKIKSRTGKTWSYNVIKTIVRRRDVGVVGELLTNKPNDSETKQ